MTPFQVLFDLDISLIDIAGKLKVIFNYIRHNSYFTCIKRNNKLVKSENSNRKCYICALGPSLKDVDLMRIDGDTIVVNRFFKIGEKFPGFIPTYYMLLDDNFSSPEHSADFLTALRTYMPLGTKFILNSKMCGNPLLNEFDSSNIFFISCFSGSFKPNKNNDFEHVLPIFENVVGASVVCAINMGYKYISLLGCDFNSFASTTRNHCYADSNTDRWYRMSFELFSYAFAARTHDMIQEYAKQKNVTITNSTRGSLIDAYPMQIEDCLYYN